MLRWSLKLTASMGRLLLLILVSAVGSGSAADRGLALEHGLRFIYKTACDPKNFADHGHDYLWCFYSIGATSSDPTLARMALAMGQERAAVWRRTNPEVAAKADANEISILAFGSYAAEQMGFPDARLKAQIREAASRLTALDFLGFDPARESPPSDVPDTCKKCGRDNPRGATVCHHCGEKLTMESRYSVWYDALITTYTGDRYGVTLGAPYSAVIRWLPSMRPYRGPEGGANAEFWDIAYAITHVVYTLDEYSRYTLSPRQFPQEFAYLRANAREGIRAKEPEAVGEFLDSLRAFGLKENDPVIRTCEDYLLNVQNPDGSWGNMKDPDIYGRYHPTWTAVDGLRDYKWKRIKVHLPAK